MTSESEGDDLRGAALQEAVDAIVQEFDHPGELVVRYTVDDGTKTTTFEVPDSDDQVELVYDGTDDDADPRVSRRSP